MDLEQLRDLIQLFEKSDLHEIEIEEEGRRMRFIKHRPQQVVTNNYVPGPQPQVMPAPLAASSEPAAAPESAVPEVEEEDLPTINSPMVGTFYSSPAPGEPPFVHVGDVIDENQAVCIVEAMKLMNEVTAKFRAEIVEVLVENGEPVEFGQPLFKVRAAE